MWCGAVCVLTSACCGGLHLLLSVDEIPIVGGWVAMRVKLMADWWLRISWLQASPLECSWSSTEWTQSSVRFRLSASTTACSGYVSRVTELLRSLL